MLVSILLASDFLTGFCYNMETSEVKSITQSLKY